MANQAYEEKLAQAREWMKIKGRDEQDRLDHVRKAVWQILEALAAKSS